MTNFDWLKSLTPEEFADWCCYNDHYDFSKDIYIGLHPHRRTIEERSVTSYGGILNWLKEERTECEKVFV